MTDPPARLKVAAAQYPIERLPDLAAVMAKHARWVGQAAAGGARLVVFPEYAAMEIAGTLSDAVAADLQASLEVVARLRPEVDANLASLAARHDIHILGPSGPARRPDGSFANTAHLMTPAGRVGIQEKIIMTPFERRWGITGGSALQVFETALGRIGVLICYDGEFPLLARAMTDAAPVGMTPAGTTLPKTTMTDQGRGARLILIPTCTERISGFNRVRSAALARALESTVATVMSPTVGNAPWSPAVDRNCGAAGVFVPAEAGVSDTGVLAEGCLDAAQLVFAEIDFAHLEQLRTAGEMRNAADWRLQPGAEAARTTAVVVDLR